MRPIFVGPCAVLAIAFLWITAACNSQRSAEPTPSAAGSGASTVAAPPARSADPDVAAPADTADSEAAQRAARAHLLRCRQQPEVCVQSPGADAEH